MKRTVTIITLSAFLTLGSVLFVPTNAQTLEIPIIVAQEENPSFPALKTEYVKLSALLPRIESTITLLTKRGFDTTDALATLEETKVAFTETKDLFEKKNVKKSTLEETMKENRVLLTQLLKEIRISLTTK